MGMQKHLCVEFKRLHKITECRRFYSKLTHYFSMNQTISFIQRSLDIDFFQIYSILKSFERHHSVIQFFLNEYKGEKSRAQKYAQHFEADQLR